MFQSLAMEMLLSLFISTENVVFFNLCFLTIKVLKRSRRRFSFLFLKKKKKEEEMIKTAFAKGV